MTDLKLFKALKGKGHVDVNKAFSMLFNILTRERFSIYILNATKVI